MDGSGGGGGGEAFSLHTRIVEECSKHDYPPAFSSFFFSFLKVISSHASIPLFK